LTPGTQQAFYWRQGSQGKPARLFLNMSKEFSRAGYPLAVDLPAHLRIVTPVTTLADYVESLPAMDSLQYLTWHAGILQCRIERGLLPWGSSAAPVVSHSPAAAPVVTPAQVVTPSDVAALPILMLQEQTGIEAFETELRTVDGLIRESRRIQDPVFEAAFMRRRAGIVQAMEAHRLGRVIAEPLLSELLDDDESDGNDGSIVNIEDSDSDSDSDAEFNQMQQESLQADTNRNGGLSVLLMRGATTLMEDVGEDAGVCTICQETLVDGQPRSINACGHVFHTECLLRLVQDVNRCPNCNGLIAVTGDAAELSAVRTMHALALTELRTETSALRASQKAHDRDMSQMMRECRASAEESG
jgi:hypothetical protein